MKRSNNLKIRTIAGMRQMILGCFWYYYLTSNQHFFCHAWIDQTFLVPGTAITFDVTSLDKRRKGLATTPEHVLIFEHTSHGAGGLVLNRPTPIVLRDLNIPRFSNGVFGQHRLYFGCGILTTNPTTLSMIEPDEPEDEDDDDDDDETVADSNNSQVAIGDMSPWFWIHDLPQIPGSFLLEGAAEPLYMGGNVDLASERLLQQQQQQRNQIVAVDPKAHFKFFWKAKVWAPGQLEDELERGIWKTVGPISPSQAFLI